MCFRRSRPAAFVMVIGLLAGACDQPAPPPLDAPAPKREAPPTTQQLLDGPKKSISLVTVPFTLDAPGGWALVDSGKSPSRQITMLEGPLLGGQGHIIFSQRDNQTPERIKTLIDHIRRDAPAIEKGGGTLRIHDMGEVRVVERRVLPPTTAPAIEAIDRPVEWRVTFFVPAGVNYEQYEMQFIDLSPAVLAQNEKLLNDVVASLKYSDAGPPPL